MLQKLMPKVKCYVSKSGEFMHNICSEVNFKAPITTAADDSLDCFVFQRKEDLLFRENPLLGKGFT